MAKLSEKMFVAWVGERIRSLQELWWQAHPDQQHVYPDITLLCQWAGERIVELERQLKEEENGN